MANVLLEYDSINPSSEIYAASFRKIVEHFGGACRAVSNTAVREEDLYWADMLVTIRGNSIMSRGVVAAAKEQGCFCIMFADDNLAELPDDFACHPLREKLFIEIASMCDALITSNDSLAERIAELSGCVRTARIDTEVDPAKILAPDHQRGDVIRVVYAAGEGHAKDFDSIVSDSLVAAIRECRLPVAVTFVGVKPRANNLEDICQVTYVPAMSLSVYRQYMREHRFDIGLAPLPNDVFTSYKYFNKFVEYTLMGIVGVYTNTPPYTEIVEDGTNGYLADNGCREWKDALTRAMDDISNDVYLAENAAETMKSRLSRSRIHERIGESIPEFVTYKKPQEGSFGKIRFKGSRIANSVFRLIELPYLSIWMVVHGQGADAKNRIRRKLGLKA